MFRNQQKIDPDIDAMFCNQLNLHPHATSQITLDKNTNLCYNDYNPFDVGKVFEWKKIQKKHNHL